MGREPVAIAIEIVRGAYAARLLLRPNRRR
jgi:hypothetical protein